MALGYKRVTVSGGKRDGEDFQFDIFKENLAAGKIPLKESYHEQPYKEPK